VAAALIHQQMGNFGHTLYPQYVREDRIKLFRLGLLLMSLIAFVLLVIDSNNGIALSILTNLEFYTATSCFLA
jgi:hypothetical protein